MSKVFFIADTHFAEQDVFEMSGENRFFNSVQEKDEAIITNWNKTVGSEDTVFILGDFGKPSYMQRLTGKKFLIRGNHDKNQVDSEYPILYQNFFILSHEPEFILEDGPFANIFGHVHNNPMYKTVSPRSYCVCACRNGYTPVSWEHIVNAMGESAHDCSLRRKF
jgi:calcineurin-like phosphoesterase family protein